MLNNLEIFFQMLNQNSGAAMAVLTAVYVIATIIIVVKMNGANKISREAIKTTVNLERSRNRPFVICWIESREKTFYAVIKNFGPQPAFDVQTKFSPEIKRGVRDFEHISFVRTNIPLLPPGMHIDDGIDVTVNRLTEYTELTHNYEIRYKDSFGEIYSETGTVSFEPFMGRISFRTDSPIEKIAKSANGIESMVRELKATASQLTWTLNNIFNRPPPAPIPNPKKNDDLKDIEFTSEEITYLRAIANEGYLSSVLAASFCGEETEQGHSMMNRFLEFGLVRKEIDRLVLTEFAYAILREHETEGDTSE